MSLSRYPRYPAYKDSGVEWLGEVPTHWEVPKMWHVSKAVSGGTPNRDESRFWDGDIPWVSPKDMKRLVIDSSEDSITEAALTESGLRLVPPQAILVVVRGMILAHTFPVAVTSVPVTINQDMKAIHFTNAIDPMFAARYLEGTGSRLLSVIVDEAAHGTKAIRMDQWRGVTLLHPPLDEQRAITDFLDRETARIDALIEKKRRLIELLQEQRAAIITRAVTRGLDPHAPMKDSGVEWLGEIPTKWEIKRIKFLAKVGNGSTPSRDEPEYWNGHYPWLNSSVVNRDEVVSGADFVTARALRECHLPKIQPPAVLVGLTGEGRTRGMASILRREATISQHVAAIHAPKSGVSVDYVRYVLVAAYKYLRELSSGAGGTKAALTCAQLGDFEIPLPRLEVQHEIVAALRSRLSRIDTVGQCIEAAIEALSDLRSSLITAAVTGAIDVRASLDADARIDAA